MSRSLRRKLAYAAVSLPLSLAVLSPVSPLVSAATAAPDPTVAEGSNWSVTTAPGGYEVTVELDEPLPIVSDAPTIMVDGTNVGLATESADGSSLTVFTSDPAVADAREVEAGWSSTAEEPVTTSATQDEVLPEASTAEALDVDPTAPGTYDWTESIYSFGDQAVDLAAIGGIRGELEGKLYVPTTGGERPVVVLLHGRHGYCYGSGQANPLRWPCSDTQLSIPSYLGYDGTARALASHGYSVVSVSANAINANDNQLASDQGAQARGQLVLDTLDMLADANAGRPVSYHDDDTGQDVTLAEALTRGTEALAERAEGFVTPPEPLDAVTPADLVGRFDLDHVGMMGHSRGGEGVTSAAVLNTMREHPFGIESVLPLAPVDFGRMTVPDVAMNVILPYCDGDVSNQQGQHLLDDSRYAFGDDVLRTGTWVMGANHNFYNTVWTPGVYEYNVSDDWSGSAARRTEPICGTDESVADTSIRMTPQEQYDQGSAYMTAWFRLTLGGEEQFLPMFDGSGAVPATLGGEDIRTQATAPSSQRATVASFEQTSSLTRTFGTATATVCASLSDRTVPQELPYCATGTGSSTVPHWTPASNGGNVPATPVTQLSWTSGTGELRVAVPARQRDVSGFDRLSVKMAAAQSVATGTDLTLSVVDGQGRTWSSPVSEINPQALVRMPTSDTATGTTYLKKLVLQQVQVPTADIAAAGVDLSDVREVRFTAAEGADGTPAGAAYLSDLAFETPGVGTPSVTDRPVVDVYAPYVDEGDGPGTYDIAVHLDEPAKQPVTGYVSLLGSTTSRAGATMEKVTFAPGETCRVVTAALQGDTAPSETAATTVKASVVDTVGGVMGRSAIVSTSIREDDGVTGSAVELPAYGTPGDVCDELAALDEDAEVVASDATPEPGDTVTLTADGFRSGEAVTFTVGDGGPVTTVADGSGTAVVEHTVPADVTRGTIAVEAVAAATGRVATGEIEALDATTTELSWSTDEIRVGGPLGLVAEVSGPDGAVDGGTVEFFDGRTSLGTASVEGGTATLEVPRLTAGRHQLSAEFGRTDTLQGSTSNLVTFVLTKRQSAVLLSLSAATGAYGTPASATVTVPGGAGGRVALGLDGSRSTVTLDASGTARLTFPATLGVGRHTVGAQFLGTDEVDPSGRVTAAYTVTKAPVSLTVAAPARKKRGKVYRVRIRVGGTVAGTPVTGRVKVQVARGNTAYKVVRRPLLRGNRVVVKVRAPKGGKVPFLRVRAQLPATGAYQGATSAVRVVTLR